VNRIYHNLTFSPPDFKLNRSDITGSKLSFLKRAHIPLTSIIVITVCLDSGHVKQTAHHKKKMSSVQYIEDGQNKVSLVYIPSFLSLLLAFMVKQEKQNCNK